MDGTVALVIKRMVGWLIIFRRVTKMADKLTNVTLITFIICYICGDLRIMPTDIFLIPLVFAIASLIAYLRCWLGGDYQ